MRRYGSQEPTFSVVGEYHHTFGPNIVRMFNKWGVVFYPCQEDEMSLFLARDRHNRYACRTICISKPRQNGKSFGARHYSIECASVEAKRVLYSAHHGKTVRKMFKAIKDLVQRTKDLSVKLLPGASGIYNAAGSEGIYFANGGCIEFQTRTNSGGRGDTYDVIIIDEAQELTDEQLDAIKPTTIASESGDPQMIYLGTPPGPKCQGTVFRGFYKKVHSGDSEGIWWLEWSVEDLPDMSDAMGVLELAYMTNPALGYRIREDVMLDAIRTATSVDGFAREFLGWWSQTEAEQPVINASDWADCATGSPSKGSIVTYAVKFSPDGSMATMAACHRSDSERPFVYVVDSRSLNHGLGWFVETLSGNYEKAAQIVIDGQGNAQTLTDRLLERGVPLQEVMRPRATDVATACSSLANAVREKTLTHYRQKALDVSATKSTARRIGTTGGWGFQSTDEADATLIEACALAYWAAMTTKRDPHRKAEIWDW